MGNLLVRDKYLCFHKTESILVIYAGSTYSALKKPPEKIPISLLDCLAFFCKKSGTYFSWISAIHIL